MKALLIILSSFAMSLSAVGREIVLQWDPNPVQDEVEAYTVWELAGPGWTKIGETSDTRYSVGDRAPGRYEFAVSARNFWGESGRSASVATPGGVPGNPQPPTIEGAKQVAFEVSEDLETWKQIAVVESVGDREFFRVAFIEREAD